VKEREKIGICWRKR